MNKMHNMFCP